MSDSVRVLHRPDFQHLLDALASRGYRIVAPTLRDGAIVYEEIHAASDLPEGWTDRQDGGTYRLERRNDALLFGYAVGPHSWKKFLFPPRTRLWQADRQPQGFTLRPEPPDAAPYAFLGVRSCELHAIAIQDKVFMDTDPQYRAHRERAFLVAVNCGQAGGTCFCVSMNTGPRAESGFDLALTEILEDGRHAFTVEAGSDRGRDDVQMLPTGEAGRCRSRGLRARAPSAVRQMGRAWTSMGVPELLARNPEQPRWDGGVALPGVRQLHDGVPDLFLQHRRGHNGSHGRSRRAVAIVGFVLHPGLLPRPRRERAHVHEGALPALADPQTLHLARPVRDLRMRGLRPMHHVVSRGSIHFRSAIRNREGAERSDLLSTGSSGSVRNTRPYRRVRAERPL
jgi:hypothetical protein